MKTPIETQLRPDADTLWAGLITGMESGIRKRLFFKNNSHNKQS